MPHRCTGIGTHWLAQVFDDEPLSTQPAYQLVPAMQVFGCAFFPVRPVIGFWKCALLIILQADHIFVLLTSTGNLQTRGGFMLADIQSAGTKYPSHFPVNRFHIR